MHSGGGGYRGGHGGYSGAHYGFRRGFGYGYGSLPLGWYSPWLWNTSSDYGYGDSSYAPPASYYSQPDVPPVIFNQSFVPEPVRPQVQEYPPQPVPYPTAPPAPVQDPNKEPLYLLATHDGTIRAVLAYWVEGNTVHYVTMEHVNKTVPLASIDRDLSLRLNQERGVSFGLPR